MTTANGSPIKTWEDIRREANRRRALRARRFATAAVWTFCGTLALINLVPGVLLLAAGNPWCVGYLAGAAVSLLMAKVG